ncbi:MAG: hypothetical protein ACTHMM_10195 [Agriterribacter sp.]
MPEVLRFIIFPVFDNQIHELLVQYSMPHKTDTKEYYSIHLTVKSPYFLSFGKRWLLIESNRPVLKGKGVKLTRRPDYKLIEGKVKYASNWEKLIEVLDDFVLKNFDS